MSQVFSCITPDVTTQHNTRQRHVRSLLIRVKVPINDGQDAQARGRASRAIQQTQKLQKQPFADLLQNECSLKFTNIYRKNTCVRVTCVGVNIQACNFIKKRLQYRCFPVNIAKF